MIKPTCHYELLLHVRSLKQLRELDYRHRSKRRGNTEKNGKIRNNKHKMNEILPGRDDGIKSGRGDRKGIMFDLRRISFCTF